MKKIGILLLIAIIVTLLTGCSTSQTVDTSTTVDTTSDTSDFTYLNAEELFSDRDKEVGYEESQCISITLNDTTASCSSDTVTISDRTITITDEGNYIISGSLNNGMIIVDAEKTDKIQLILNGTEINCDTSAALYIKQADKVFVTLAADTDNILSNTSGYTAIDENNIDAVIFSKDDLTLNGSGSLNIQASLGHGIVSKDDLMITGGDYTVKAEKHALSGNDRICIAAGTFTLTSGSDGLHADNTEDTSLGYIYIGDGNFEIASGTDGIDASGIIQIDSGTFQISTADAGDDISTKGVKAANTICIRGGDYTIDSSDDSIHSNEDIRIEDGTFRLTSLDDGIHADSNVTILGGTVSIPECYEGIEGQSIDITDGTIQVTASDDGLNAAGGNDQTTTDGRPGMDQFAADENAYINISGGSLTISAGGDGIDSNGDLGISGGEIQVSNTTNSGNGVIDYNGTGTITGGTFLSSGFSGMAQNFGEDSTQGSVLVNVDSQSAETEITLTDSNGNTLLSYTADAAYNSVLISCADFTKGETYTLTCGSAETAITLDSLIYGESGGMGGMGGTPGGKGGGGEKRQNGQAPSGEVPDGQTPGGEQMTPPENNGNTSPETQEGTES